MKTTRRPREREGDILSVFTIDKSDRAPGPITPDIASFLAPLTLPQFIENHYQKQRALAVKVHPSLRESRISFIKQMMADFNPRTMLAGSNSAADGISVWMKPQKSDTGSLCSVKMKPEDAFLAYSAGMSLYFRGSEELESTFVPAYMQQLGFGCGSFFRDGARRGEIEVFASQEGHITNPHFDFQSVNFTVQLRGRKAWSLSKNKTIPFPAKACATHFRTDAASTNIVRSQHSIHALAVESQRADGKGVLDMEPEEFLAAQGGEGEEPSALETVVLEPGDILFHPSGVWHRVETLPGSSSLSINFSLFPQSYGELMSETLQTMLMRHSHWRRPVCTLAPSASNSSSGALVASGGAGVDAVRAQLNVLISSLRDELTALDAHHILPEAVTQEGQQGAPREIILSRFVLDEDDEQEAAAAAAPVLRVAKTVPASRKLELRSKEAAAGRNIDLQKLRLRRNPLAVLVELNRALDLSDQEDADDDDESSNDDDDGKKAAEKALKRLEQQAAMGDDNRNDDDDDDDMDMDVDMDDSSSDDEDGENTGGEFLEQDHNELVCFDLTSNVANAGAEEGHFGAPAIRCKIRVPIVAEISDIMRKASKVAAGSPVTAGSVGFTQATLDLLHVLLALGFFSLVAASPAASKK